MRSCRRCTTQLAAYLREAASSDEFSAKDFRTWHATVLAHRALGSAEPPEDGRRTPDPVRAAIRATAELLNDTPAVTRSAYVHPAVLEAFDPETARRSRRHRRTGAPIERAEELAVLDILRRANHRDRTGGSGGRARRPASPAQPEHGRHAGRANRPAA